MAGGCREWDISAMAGLSFVEFAVMKIILQLPKMSNKQITSKHVKP